ncbi:MAG: CrcB family protein [Candidatus Cohnella colombiensis]|uniref:Fluoride-specific ion channel FluC n=1 Tax=Candidatus Cohnella colombiensis TaxID=3121368 RepID=A0AA95ETX5_9BACL|nr:MAG: CrcB family protein [Cohnella sp.]
MNEWAMIVAIGSGGAIGTLLRYGVGKLLERKGKPTFYGTLIVNLVGCLSIGVVMGLHWNEENIAAYAFFATGILGGLTTYSTLNVQKVTLRTSASRLTLVVYLIATYAGGLLATALGALITNLLIT